MEKSCCIPAYDPGTWLGPGGGRVKLNGRWGVVPNPGGGRAKFGMVGGMLGKSWFGCMVCASWFGMFCPMAEARFMLGPMVLMLKAMSIMLGRLLAPKF